MENNEFISESPKMKSEKVEDQLTDNISPITKSRYGRTQKPKIVEDFYNIDDIIDDSKVRKRSSKSPVKCSPKYKPSNKEVVKKPGRRTKSPLKSPKSSLPPLVAHVTGDLAEDDFCINNHNGVTSTIDEQKPVNDYPKKKKFFKTHTPGSKIQNMTKLYIQKSEPSVSNNAVCAEPLTNLEIEDKSAIDVTKILKLVTNNPEAQNSDSQNKASAKSSIKTYTNKRKSYQKSEVLESFGLPDEPIIPVENSVILERNSAIDVDNSKLHNVNIDSSFCGPIWKENEFVGDKEIVIKQEKFVNGYDDESTLEFEKSPKIVENSLLPGRNTKITKLSRKTNRIKKRNSFKNKDPQLVDSDAVKNEFQTSSPIERKRILKRNSNVNNVSRRTTRSSNLGISVESIKPSFEKQPLDMGLTVDTTEYDLSTVIKNEPCSPDILENTNIEFESKTLKQELLNDGFHELKTSEKNSQEIKQEANYNLGDIVWARIGCFPYWPSMIVTDPHVNTHVKTAGNLRVHTLHHVRFFGDRGRRSWVSNISLLPFTGIDDLIKVRETGMFVKKTKQHQSLFVSTQVQPKWQLAVDEAHALLLKSLDEKIEFFKQYENTTIEAKQNLSLPQAKIKKDKHKQPRGKPRGLSKSLIKQEVIEKEIILDSKEKNPELVQKMPRKSARLSLNLANKSISENKSQSPPLLHENIKNLRSGSIASDYSSDNEWNVISVSPKNPMALTIEDQIALFKRNNLFRGVSKEKVCHACEKPSDVLKCKGKCTGVYHKNCKVEAIDSESHLVSNQVSIPEIECQSVDNSEESNQQIESNDEKSVPQRKISISEQIDIKMKEIMEQIETKNIYADSTTDCSSDDSSDYGGPFQKHIQHVTADHILFENDASQLSKKTFKCGNCTEDVDLPCTVCHRNISTQGSNIRQKCSINYCGKFFHANCLKTWPQTQWSLISTTKHKDSDQRLATFVCPMHYCHICISDDPRAAISRLPADKLVKCLRCPATYHAQNYCIPAGSEILSTTQIICPRHIGSDNSNKTSLRKILTTINTAWCHICSKGGDIICCETCPTSVHSSCVDINLLDDGTFICEDCETGRYPLYDEIVWAKYGTYRWWPALILFPNEIPENIHKIPHERGQFVVKFFGTNDHCWITRGRVFLYQEGDNGNSNTNKRVDVEFQKAIAEAAEAYVLKTEFKSRKEAEIRNNGIKPPHYIRIKSNKPVGNVRQFDGNVSNTTPCECDPNQPCPCGPDTNCLNRLLLTECDPDVCAAGERCNNQYFEKRVYPPLTPYRTDARGWGLKTLVDIKKGQFVIEYVGEMIDEQEYQRRLKKMHEQKEENYYFLTIDKDRMIDAGPKGNVARFMNHSCDPNTETQKWTVKGDTRVGLFALKDISADSELTFNYNLECVGEEKKICRCGAKNCSGYIGLKLKEEPVKKHKKISKRGKWKRRKPSTSSLQTSVICSDPCFVCGKVGDTNACQNKICTKVYHLKCVNLEVWPDGKWVCPWHNCNICTKRTIRCCVKCTNSYCPIHSDGNVRYDKLLGFICFEHDPMNANNSIEVQNADLKMKKESCTPTKETDVTSTTSDEIKHNSTLDDPSESNVTIESNSTLDSTVSSTPNEILDLDSSLIYEGNDKQEIKPVGKKRRGRPRKSAENPAKKIKLNNSNESQATPGNHQAVVNMISSYNSQEIILSSTVPSRHLRAAKNSTDDTNLGDRLLKRKREYEKDLPIRKRYIEM